MLAMQYFLETNVLGEDKRLCVVESTKYVTAQLIMSAMVGPHYAVTTWTRKHTIQASLSQQITKGSKYMHLYVQCVHTLVFL